MKVLAITGDSAFCRNFALIRARIFGLVLGLGSLDGSTAQSQTMYYYYGTVSGLGPAAIPLTISDNDQVENIYTNGVFQFVSNSAQYNFSVSQPSGGAITCTVQNG